MSHARTQIRNAVKALITGLTTTGANVYTTKKYSFKETQLPSLNIKTENEEPQAIDLQRPRELRRLMEVKVECRVKLAGDIDTELDNILAEVETVLGNTTLSGLVKDFSLKGIETEDDDESEQPTGMATMIWIAHYKTQEGAPETLL